LDGVEQHIGSMQRISHAFLGGSSFSGLRQKVTEHAWFMDVGGIAYDG
jgi:hypothetical protein